MPYRACIREGENEVSAAIFGRVRRSPWTPAAIATVLLLAVVATKVRTGELTGTRNGRLTVELAAFAFIATGLFVRERLIDRRLSSELRLADERIRLALESGEAVDGTGTSGADATSGSAIPGPCSACRSRASWAGSQISSTRPSRRPAGGAARDGRSADDPYDISSDLSHRPRGQTTRWATGIGRFHYSASGEAVRMLGVAADITDRMAIDQGQAVSPPSWPRATIRSSNRG